MLPAIENAAAVYRTHGGTDNLNLTPVVFLVDILCRQLIMRGTLSEYLLKGVFLGLLFYVSLLDRNWEHITELGVGVAVGLGAAIVAAFLIQIRNTFRFVRKPHTALLFVLLENPLLIYAGLILGLTGAWMYCWDTGVSDKTFYFCMLGGLALGYGIHELRGIPDWRYRIGCIVLVGLGLGYGIDSMFERLPSIPTEAERESIGAHLLFGLPLLYLLIFFAKAEESEADVGVLCAFLGLALYLMKFPKDYPYGTFIIPLALFFIYTIYVLPNLRPFKHTLRGFCYLEMHKTRPALLSFRKAIELDRRNRLAHDGLEAVHLKIDLDQLDSQTLGLLDRELCLNRARMLLNRKPTETERIKAERFLNLVEKQWPKWISHVLYFRAILALHQGHLDAACDLLDDLLNPEGWFANDPQRKAILWDAWQLVLLVHPKLTERVGNLQLALPGRRMEAIAALERELARAGNDPILEETRLMLYRDLQETEFWAVARDGLPVDFNYAFAEQLGLSVIADPNRFQRGAEFLRVAACGLPLRRPLIYQKLAEAHARSGETIEASKYYRQIRDAAIEVGVENLAADQKSIYIATVKKLADEARLRNEYDEAIYNYSLATYSDDGIKETLRMLADMYEKKRDVLNALRINEKALIYDGRDQDLLARKDRYYYSLEPDQLREAARSDANVRKYFDVEYCIRRGRQVLENSPGEDLDNLDWAEHLLKLASLMQPGRMSAQILHARCLLRRGDRMEAVQILEDIKERTPSGTEESDAWYFAQKQLGLLYLNELNRPDLAVGCFEAFLKHIGSGAQSLYDLGRAHEANGNIPEAIKAYNQVTAYEGNALAWDAKEAVRRLKDQLQTLSGT